MRGAARGFWVAQKVDGHWRGAQEQHVAAATLRLPIQINQNVDLVALNALR
jgi:hypothetical protein